jgi:hypothetical protein
LETRNWWSQAGSNRRPQHCQWSNAPLLDKVRAALLAKGLTEAALRDLLADEPPVGEGRGFDEDASAAYSARRGYYLPSTR